MGFDDMRVHDALDDMMDSRSKIRILRLLFRYPGKEFTEREMAEMIAMSPNTVNLALRDLRKTNVFAYKRLGRTHSYRCNKDSVHFAPLSALFDREREMWDSLVAALKEKLSGVVTCIIYGSFAEGKERFDSDLDLLVVARDKSAAEELLAELAEDLRIRYSIVISPVVLTQDEMNEKKDLPFIKKALSEGIVLVKGEGDGI